MNDVPIIDLDHPDPEDAHEPGPHAAGGRPPWIGLAMLVPVCLAAFSGAVHTPTPPMTYVGLIPSFIGALPDDSLPTPAAGMVVAEHQGEAIAHHPDGRPAWRTRPLVEPSVPNAVHQISEWEGFILLTRITLKMVGDIFAPSGMVTAGLEPATGRVRWIVQGSPKRAGDLIVVSSEQWAGSTAPRVYRSLTDGPLWTGAPARMFAVDTGSGALLTLTDEGHFTEYELSTGNTRRTATLRLPHVAQDEELTMRLFGGRLTLRATIPYRPGWPSEALSYDRTTLEPAPSPLDHYVRLTECGTVLCASTDDSTYILDRDSLAELWRTAPGDFPTWTDAGLLLHAREPRIVDERTGNVRVNAGGWTPVGNLRGMQTAQQTPPPVMTLRIGRRTYVARLTPRTVQVIGIIPQGLNRCVYHNTLLICRAVDGRTQVWRINSRM